MIVTKNATICLQTIVLAMCVLASCNPIASSHIRANVPGGADFDQILQRDLEAYFRDSSGQDVTIEYELLRQGPTQSGVAYPKFYAWVKIYRDNNVLHEGAVRVAAVEQIRFDVTHYLNKDQIKDDPKAIYFIFPEAVCKKIEEKID